ncbi:ROK family protein [Sphingoaurantiacus capsulatus]|uniref:fructokinase n=1 Tax=Sphingoaurantiacus capsulatus TaxID=1771310 RepID=A0ABV7XFM7_9SPHN
MNATPLYAAIEAGGTKINVAVGSGPADIRRRARIATRHPDETMPEIAAFLDGAVAEFGPLAGLGIATFGPADLDPASPTYGCVFAGTKPGWDDTDILGPFVRQLGCPAAIDTDVNGAALGEARWGAGKGFESIVYFTVGTGIGGGFVQDEKTRHGLTHPEMGHVLVRRHPHDAYPGICRFHGDCVEGLASGPAIRDRLGAPLDELPEDHPFRAILADYLGQLCAQAVFLLSPQRIVLGGGVMNAGGLHGPVTDAMRRYLAGFIPHPRLKGDDYLVPPALGDDAGIAGAFALAMDASRRASR